MVNKQTAAGSKRVKGERPRNEGELARRISGVSVARVDISPGVIPLVAMAAFLPTVNRGQTVASGDAIDGGYVLLRGIVTPPEKKIEKYGFRPKSASAIVLNMKRPGVSSTPPIVTSDV